MLQPELNTPGGAHGWIAAVRLASAEMCLLAGGLQTCILAAASSQIFRMRGAGSS
jgi:hypothetical protein